MQRDSESFTSLAGWHKAKEALGPKSIAGQAMQALESYCAISGGGCPRHFLAVAIHAYLRSGQPYQDAALMSYVHNRESEVGFREALAKIMAQ